MDTEAKTIDATVGNEVVNDVLAVHAFQDGDFFTVEVVKQEKMTDDGVRKITTIVANEHGVKEVQGNLQLQRDISEYILK